jgi:hypothetical protein
VNLEPIDSELLDHLIVEFGSHGRRAVDFLQTAEELLGAEHDQVSPRLPETIMYCLREAMKAIPASQDVGASGLWRSASLAITEARQRFLLARDVAGEDEEGALRELLARIDDLELVQRQEGIHQLRLIAAIVDRTGAPPVEAGTAPIRAYQALLVELDEAVHNTATLEDAHRCWNQCSALLRQLFLPPEVRHRELDVLASDDRPGTEDVDRLLSLVSGPNHVRYFLSRITSPEWLDALMETGILDPPAKNAPWPVFAAINRLAQNHSASVCDWLHRMYNRHAGDIMRLSFIVRAAASVGDDGAPLVLRGLRDHGSDPAIAPLGVLAAQTLDPKSQIIEEFADILLNSSPWESAGYVEPIIKRLVGGITDGNCARRLQLMCMKLRRLDRGESSWRWFVYERAGSLADWGDEGPDDRFSVLLGALVRAIGSSWAWMSTEELFAIVDSLPEDLRGRVRAWVLAAAPDVELSQVIEEVAKAIGQRDPTGDDLTLIDRVIASADPAEYAERWTAALGHVPSAVEVAQRLATRSLPAEWLRAYRWASLLPEPAVEAWARPASVIAAVIDLPAREALEQRRPLFGGFVQPSSPITAEELASLPPIDAARSISRWRRDPSDWKLSPRELARTLEEIVKANIDAWLEAPLGIVTELRDPTYVHHYLEAVADALGSASHPPVVEILEVIEVIRAHPWPVAQERDDFEYDNDWRGVEQAAVEVLRALASNDLGFAGRDESVWRILEEEVRDGAKQSGYLDADVDPFQSAMNRRSGRALHAVLSYMGYEFRSTGAVPSEVFELLSDVLRLEGSDGAEHRAILATRLGFLRHVAAQWVDAVADLFFGSAAPDGLSQVTADITIKWSRPNRWFLEHYRSLVLDAINREVDHALDHFLVAMLWRVPSYSVSENISFLRRFPSHISRAGEMLGRLLQDDQVSDDHIALAVSFWEAAIDTRDPQALTGFGWMAEVNKLNDETWTDLTMRTLAITHGRVDWSQKVAERTVSCPASTTTLAIMNSLVRGSTDEWDRHLIVERASALLQSATALGHTAEYKRLHTTTLERGAAS